MEFTKKSEDSFCSLKGSSLVGKKRHPWNLSFCLWNSSQMCFLLPISTVHTQLVLSVMPCAQVLVAPLAWTTAASYLVPPFPVLPLLIYFLLWESKFQNSKQIRVLSYLDLLAGHWIQLDTLPWLIGAACSSLPTSPFSCFDVVPLSPWGSHNRLCLISQTWDVFLTPGPVYMPSVAPVHEALVFTGLALLFPADSAKREVSAISKSLLWYNFPGHSTVGHHRFPS